MTNDILYIWPIESCRGEKTNRRWNSEVSYGLP